MERMGDGRNASLGTTRQRGRFFVLVLAASVTAALAVPFGCGLDDSAVVAIESLDGGGDGTILGSDGGPIGDDSGADVIVCTPETCANYPSVCKAGLANGCGATIDCTAACPSGQACIAASGTCDGPPVCRDAGAAGGNCGEIINPGNLLDASCGNCANPGYTCVSSACTCAVGGTVCGANCCNGGSPNCNSTNNTCCLKNTMCVANTCSATNADNCGGNFDCSNNCGSGTSCGTDKVCAVPPTCTNKGNPGGNCGTVTGTHGLTIDCGTCGGGATCSGTTCTCASGKFCNVTCCGSSSNVCDLGNNCCAPDPTSATCSHKCGNVADNCGQNVACGTCGEGDVCEGSAQCACGGSGLKCNPGQTCHTNGTDKCM